MELTIGARIAQRRKSLGLTGAQIKELTGISTGNLSGIEKGSSLPSATALLELSKVLNCSVDWILTGNSPNSENTTSPLLSTYDIELLTTYHQLDLRGQHRVHMVIYEELDRMKTSETEGEKHAI